MRTMPAVFTFADAGNTAAGADDSRRRAFEIPSSQCCGVAALAMWAANSAGIHIVAARKEDSLNNAVFEKFIAVFLTFENGRLTQASVHEQCHRIFDASRHDTRGIGNAEQIAKTARYRKAEVCRQFDWIDGDRSRLTFTKNPSGTGFDTAPALRQGCV
jgi:hypothetical protein